MLKRLKYCLKHLVSLTKNIEIKMYPVCDSYRTYPRRGKILDVQRGGESLELDQVMAKGFF